MISSNNILFSTNELFTKELESNVKMNNSRALPTGLAIHSFFLLFRLFEKSSWCFHISEYQNVSFPNPLSIPTCVFPRRKWQQLLIAAVGVHFVGTKYNGILAPSL